MKRRKASRAGAAVRHCSYSNLPSSTPLSSASSPLATDYIAVVTQNSNNPSVIKNAAEAEPGLGTVSVAADVLGLAAGDQSRDTLVTETQRQARVFETVLSSIVDFA